MITVKPLIRFEKIYQSLKLEQELKSDLNFENEVFNIIRNRHKQKIVKTSKGIILFRNEKSLGITTIVFENELRGVS